MNTTAAISHSSTLVVAAGHTAKAMGSGDLEVLATPALAALMENAAMLAARPLLDDGQTTVGSSIHVDHLRPSPVGATVGATATLQQRDGRRLSFVITATQSDVEVGKATHVRYIVDRQRFLEKM